MCRGAEDVSKAAAEGGRLSSPALPAVRPELSSETPACRGELMVLAHITGKIFRTSEYEAKSMFIKESEGLVKNNYNTC